MTAILIVTLQLSAAPPAHWVEFVGFSKDGRLAAYRHDVRIPRDDGTFDQYSLVQTVDVASGYPVASFKASAIARITPKGRPVRIRKADLHAANPDFARAYANHKWKKLKRRSGFKKVRVAVDGSRVRIEGDQVAQKRQKDALLVAHSSGGSLAFQVQAETAGGPVELAQLDQAASDGQSVLARMQIFASRSGRATAVVVLFLVNEDGQAHTIPKVVVTRTDEPIGRAPRARAAKASGRRSWNG